MHHARKGQQWFFGLKARIGLDSKEGIVHSVCTSAVSVADKHMLPNLLPRRRAQDGGRRRLSRQTEAIKEVAPKPKT